MTELQKLQQQAREKLESDTHMVFQDSVYKSLDTLIATAYHAGRNAAVDYIESHSEEAVLGLFYVTNPVLEAARIAQ